MDNKYTKSYTAGYYDFDANMNFKPSSALSYLQDAGGRHADILKVGKNHLLEKGLFFALTKIKCEFLGRIYPDTELIVNTTPTPSGKMILGRDFIVTDPSGKVLIKCASKWGLVSLQTRRAVLVSEIGFNPQPAFESGVTIAPVIISEGKLSYTYRPAYSDIDFNGHVNNARYADAVMNACSGELDGKSIKSLQINYNKESKAGDVIDIYSHQIDNRIILKGICGEETRIISEVELCSIF